MAALLAGLVAACSGFLGGVSMIGLTIRTLVIILALGRAETRDIIFAVVVSTVITPGSLVTEPAGLVTTTV